MPEFKLNPAQKEAVTYTDSPLLIVAGAGTGKTRVISEKIKYLIQEEHFLPRDILAVTFTEKAAQEMEERVSEFVTSHLEPPVINTFHGLCYEILQNDGLHIGISSDIRLVSRPEQLILLYDNFHKLELDYYKPIANPTSALNDLLNLFSKLKSENITEADFQNYVSEKEDELQKGNLVSEEDEEELKRIKEEAKSYKNYNEILRQNNCLDYGDMIQLTFQLLSTKKNILKKYQNRYKYILVDEFQDTNVIQNQIINLLAKEHKKICVVGDDDQSIFHFQGASINNILNFDKEYPDCKKIVLTENYRSGQKILDASYRLIQANNPDRLEETLNIDKRLVSNQKFSGNIRKVTCASWENELNFIAETIQNELKAGKQYKDIAILYRSHKNGENIIPLLQNLDIPYMVLEGPGLYETEEIQKLRNLLKFIANPDDSVSLFDVLTLPIFNIEPLLLVRLSNYADKYKIGLFTALRNYLKELSGQNGAGELTLFSAGLESPETQKIQTALEELSRLIKMQTEKSSIQIIYEILYGDFAYIKQIEEVTAAGIVQDQKIANLTKFYRRAERFEYSAEDRSLKNFNRILDVFIEAGEDPDQERITQDYNAVSLLTIHKAKGLEFETVLLIELAQRKFPVANRKDRIPIPEKLQKSPTADRDFHIREERRLMYVAMTRAKENLYLVYAKKGPDSLREVKPSMFFEEIDDSLVEKITHDHADIEKIRSIYTLKSINETDIRADLKVDSIENTISLSYSNIISYLTCPLKFKYQKIYKIPSEPTASIEFGQLIHRVLEHLHRSINQGISLSEEQLIDYYEKNWRLKTSGFRDQDHIEQYKKEGEKILRNYYKQNLNDFRKALFLEKRFTFFVNQFQVRGVIDRIDSLDNEGSCEVVDYKTGRPYTLDKLKKDKNKILQLYIYAIACQDQLNLNATKLSFYYLTDGSKITIEPTPEDLGATDEIISETAKQIQSGDFTSKPEERKCNYCEYNKICPARYKKA